MPEAHKFQCNCLLDLIIPLQTSASPNGVIVLVEKCLEGEKQYRFKYDHLSIYFSLIKKCPPEAFTELFNLMVKHKIPLINDEYSSFQTVTNIINNCVTLDQIALILSHVNFHRLQYEFDNGSESDKKREKLEFISVIIRKCPDSIEKYKHEIIENAADIFNNILISPQTTFENVKQFMKHPFILEIFKKTNTELTVPCEKCNGVPSTKFCNIVVVKLSYIIRHRFDVDIQLVKSVDEVDELQSKKEYVFSPSFSEFEPANNTGEKVMHINSSRYTYVYI